MVGKKMSGKCHVKVSSYVKNCAEHDGVVGFAVRAVVVELLGAQKGQSELVQSDWCTEEGA